jgi:hypothetical protein
MAAVWPEKGIEELPTLAPWKAMSVRNDGCGLKDCIITVNVDEPVGALSVHEGNPVDRALEQARIGPAKRHCPSRVNGCERASAQTSLRRRGRGLTGRGLLVCPAS